MKAAGDAYERTAHQTAAERGKFEVAETLLESGAHVNGIAPI